MNAGTNFGAGIFSLVTICVHALAEQQGNAPCASQSDDCVDDAAEQTVLTAEKPCDYVKAEKKSTDVAGPKVFDLIDRLTQRH